MHVYACFSTCLLLESNISLCFLSLVQNLISTIALRLPKSNSLLPNQLLQCLAVAIDFSLKNLQWSCMLIDFFPQKNKIFCSYSDRSGFLGKAY